MINRVAVWGFTVIHFITRVVCSWVGVYNVQGNITHEAGEDAYTTEASREQSPGEEERGTPPFRNSSTAAVVSLSLRSAPGEDASGNTKQAKQASTKQNLQEGTNMEDTDMKKSRRGSNRYVAIIPWYGLFVICNYYGGP